MARAIFERELTLPGTGHVPFDTATDRDDADIRRLLRENPMPGHISVSLEREPNYFADAHLPGQTKQTIICREGNRVVCMGSCTIRQRFINGHPRRVGYLGGLRLDARKAGRFDIVRRGYEFFHQLQAGAPADFYFTSIAADNKRARQFLERGLRGMPHYEFIGEFVTALLPAQRGFAAPGFGAITGELAVHLNNYNQHYQLAPCWSEAELTALEPLGFHLEEFRQNRAALWDQRAFKQNVVRGYGKSLRLARPLLNLAANFTGAPRLPAVGETVAIAFISHLTTPPEEQANMFDILFGLGCKAAQSGIELLAIGFVADDPRLAAVRRVFRCREYRSRLYIVRWPDCGGSAQELDKRTPAPEAALL